MSADSLACSTFLVAVIVVVVVFQVTRAKQLTGAREAYRQSLAELKGDPRNPDLKERTLALGRIYSNLTRKRRGVTLFDEVALMNDINAACARAESAVNTHGAHNPDSHEDRLNRLTRLRRSGAVTEEEYQTRRAEILREL